jgi:hypothetical protein
MDKLPLVEAVCEHQPAELKLKLLPFQKEGLGWMLRQEISKASTTNRLLINNDYLTYNHDYSISFMVAY